MNCYLSLAVTIIVGLNVVTAGWNKEVGGFVDDVENSAMDRISNVVTGDEYRYNLWWDEHRLVVLATSIPIGTIIIIVLLGFCCYKCCCSVRPIAVYQPLQAPSTVVISTTGIQGPMIAHR